jgi:TolA-binding protein
MRRPPWSISRLLILAFLAVVPIANATDLRFAHSLYKDKRYELAADEYKSFLKANPRDAKVDEARFYLGESLVQLQKLADAADAYEAVSPTDATYRKRAMLRAGTIRKRLGDANRAAKAFEAFLDEFPEDAEASSAWVLLADCRLALNRIAAAEEAVGSARRLVGEGDKWWGRLRLVEAELLKAKGKHDAAAEILQGLAVSSDPLASEASLRLGSALFAERRFAEAAAAFDRAAASNDRPTARTARYNAGLCHLELNDWREAVRRFAPVFAAPIPEEDADGERLFAQSGQALVQAHLGAGDRTAARSAVEDALRRLGRSPAAWEFKRLSAEIDLAEGRAADAAATLRILLRDVPADADRSAIVAVACRTAAATGDANWAGDLLDAFPVGAARINAERTLSEADWKDASAVDRLLEVVSDATAKARLQYRVAALDLEAGRPTKAVERLQSIAASPNLPADLHRNAAYVLGGALVQLQRWSDALDPLERYLQAAFRSSNPSDDAALTTAAKWWARSLTWLSDADAQKRLEPLLNADRRPVLETVAASFAAERRGELALWLLDRLSPPETRVSAVIAARCYVDLKRPREALQKLATPSTQEEQYLAGVAHLMLGDSGHELTGRALLKQVADAEPPAPWSLDAAMRLARFARAPAEIDEAERRLARLAAAAKGADHRRLRLESIFLVADAGRTLQAIADLKTFLDEEKATPEAVEAALKLAELHDVRREAAQADAAIAAAERQDVGRQASGPLLFRRAALAYRNKDWAKAERLLADFTNRFPNEETAGAASLMLAEIALERQRADDAVRRFTVLKENKDPGVRATAMLRLAQALLLAKRYDEAERTADEFLGRAGQSPGRIAEAHFVRGRALMSRAKFADGRVAFEKAAVDDATEVAAKARFMIGETYFHQKKFDAAIKEYLKLALLGRDDEWRAAALLQVGKCHENLGDTAAAADNYRRVIDQYPAAPAAKAARERIQQVQIGARDSESNGVKE